MVLRINGRRVQGNHTMLGLLARLFDNLGTVIPYEQLCLLIGHKSANSAATHVLRQYIRVAPGRADCEQSALCDHRSP